MWGGGREGDIGIVMEVGGDDMRNLRGGMVLMLMRAGISVGGVVVVVVGRDGNGRGGSGIFF